MNRVCQLKHPALAAFPLLFLLFLQPSSAGSSLSLEERIQAQRVIDRLRFGHQVGATKSFDEAVPPSATERKVLASLKESVALETYWNTPVTEEALRLEMERIEARTLDPSRLRELYAALGNDEQRILEMVARPSLVGRLTRNFFSFDQRIHGEARREAQEIEAGLRGGTLDPRSENTRRIAVELLEEDEASGVSSIRSLNPADLKGPMVAARTQRLEPGTIALSEGRDAFVVQTVLQVENSTKLVSYTVPKRPWESWWSDVERDVPASQARTVASRSSLPKLRALDSVASREWQQGTTSLTTCQHDNTWNTAPFDSLPRSMAGHKALWTGTEMIVWVDKRLGGLRYNPLTDTWKEISTIGAPEPEPDPFGVTQWGDLQTTAVWTGSEMIVWDGFQAIGGRYNPLTDTWRPVARQGVPSRRTEYSAIWTGTEMIVWGGRGTNGVLNTGARYDPISDIWRPVSVVQAPPHRAGAAVFWTGNRMIVWGGWPSPQADGGGLYDPVTDSWATMSTVGSLPGGPWPPAVWAGDQMIVMSRSCGIDSRRYVPETNTWSSIPSYTDPVWRCVGNSTSTTRTWTGKELILWEGGQKGAKYDPVLGRWTSISSTNAPSARLNHSVVWTGELMIVWGGTAGSSGGRYDPSGDTWTPTASSVGPEERISHTAVWTGNEMIVWGGGTIRLQPTYGGARYDALTGQWKDLPKEGAPLEGSVLWTGDDMIVWKGLGTGGARYNPISDSWRPMSTTNAPPPEANSSLTWTGKEAILWGGTIGGSVVQYPRVGGIYDPVHDTWRLTSAVGAPRGRMRHTAVWTGEELIIWGGVDCNGGHCDGDLGGRRYNPFTDTWKTMRHEDSGPTTVARIEGVWNGKEVYYLHPYWGSMLKYDPRSDSWSNAKAPGFLWNWPFVWTGEEIIVAGGFTGARFSPATGEWIRLSPLNSPLPRGWSSAVWTGKSMIVWGGQISGPEDSATKTGGIYYLETDSDRDGFTTCQGDCNDAEATISPGNRELPGDLIDENCDGVLACPPPTSRRSMPQFLKCVAAECGRIVRRGEDNSQQCVKRVDQALKATRCDDGRLSRAEACDGSDLAGMTCETLGLTGGTLACNDSCDGFDTSQCASVCGDGLVSGPEKCDGANLAGESCESQGFDFGTLACTASCRNLDTTLCSTTCGDGVIRGYEVCDSSNFRGKECGNYTFDGGALSCAPTCDRIDLATCTTACGDGVQGGFELCDGTDLGMTCWWLGYERGALGCNATCDAFDVSECAFCGDGQRSGDEVCDGIDVGGETCESLGYSGGNLRCNEICGYTGCF